MRGRRLANAGPFRLGGLKRFGRNRNATAAPAAQRPAGVGGVGVVDLAAGAAHLDGQGALGGRVVWGNVALGF